jgi:cell division GTPase FtsZ
VTDKKYILRAGEFGKRQFPVRVSKERNEMSEKPIEEQMQDSLKAAAGEPVPGSNGPPSPGVPAGLQATPVSAPVPPIAAPTPPAAASGVVNIANVAAALAPNVSSQAEQQVVVEDAHGYDVAFKFAFIGSGQGGGRLACAFHDLGYRRVAVLNTTESDFAGLPEEVHKHSFNVGGAAKDAQFAADTIAGREEEVWDLMQRAWGNDMDYVFVCAGLGGGTGSGTAAKLVEIARKYMESKGKPPRVGVIASLPEAGEGQQICRNALQSLKWLLDAKVSPAVLVDNHAVRKLYKPSFTAVHSTINSTVAQLFHIFNQLAAVHSPFVTFDRSELAQLLDNGITVMGAAALAPEAISSPADISAAIRDQLANSVLAEVDIRKGKKGAVIFVGDIPTLDRLSMDYFDAGFTQMSRTLGSEGGDSVVVHRGVYPGSAPGLQAYAMISELQPPAKKLTELAKVANISKADLGSEVAKFLGVDG